MRAFLGGFGLRDRAEEDTKGKSNRKDENIGAIMRIYVPDIEKGFGANVRKENRMQNVRQNISRGIRWIKAVTFCRSPKVGITPSACMNLGRKSWTVAGRFRKLSR